MKRMENDVILLGVLKKRTQEEEERLSNIIKNNQIDWSYVAGQLVHHRLTGYFYNFIGQELMNFILPEFRSTMRLLVNAQKLLAQNLYTEIKPVLMELEKEHIRYAGLKGMVYGMTIYPMGSRRSNDCDILVVEEDLEKLDQILRGFGYIQSSDYGKTEATKKEKLIQRMNYHDLIPYFKNTDLVLQNYIKIDINFHIDSKDNDITKDIYELGTEIYEKDGYFIRGLNPVTHFLHLCIHFYREGSNTLWTCARRDVLLYKLVDIINTLRDMEYDQLLECIEVSKKFNLEKAVYFTLYYINQFYGDKICEKLISLLKVSDPEFINRIVVEGRERVLEREISFYDKAFDLKFNYDFRTKRG